MFKSARRISRDHPIAQDAIVLLKQLWVNIPLYSTHVSVPNPVTLSTRDVSTMARGKDDYFVSCKLDGVRQILLMGVTENNANTYAIMIDRSYNMYTVSTSFIVHDSYFQGTLIDGELVRHNGRMFFVAFDMVTVKGMDYSRESYETRMETLRKVLKEIEIIGCECVVKDVVPLKDVSQWRTLLDDTILPSDGLIFMPNSTPVMTGTHKTMYKWKQTNTLDFALHKGDDGEYSLRFTGIDNKEADTRKINLYLDPSTVESIDVDETKLPIIVECACDLQESTDQSKVVCRILCPRPDKTVPNYEKTIVSTLRVIKEKIDVEYIIDQCM